MSVVQQTQAPPQQAPQQMQKVPGQTQPAGNIQAPHQQSSSPAEPQAQAANSMLHTKSFKRKKKKNKKSKFQSIISLGERENERSTPNTTEQQQQDYQSSSAQITPQQHLVNANSTPNTSSTPPAAVRMKLSLAKHLIITLKPIPFQILAEFK